ncbi:MAG: ATP-binding protein [Pseudomonadota bacterium]
MVRPYEATSVWSKAFASLESLQLRTLSSQYGQAWDRACSIAARIQGDAPGLTLHDERHFVALWEAVDLLVGEEIELNPLEVFILGVAIVIHDAAHTTLAFEGGFDAVCRTPEWSDSLATILGDAPFSSIDDLDPAIKRAALFETLRALHAKRAEKILEMSFRHPSLDTKLHVLEDPVLRAHLGSVIGQVAASHHWDLAKVARLSKSLDMVSPYHLMGSIRPVLLAALMRTADAIQIDGQRASDFEFALTNPQGVSQDHWSAQNRLAKGTDPDDASALRFNSTRKFGPSDASAWWVAFDLATTADRELRTTNALLRDMGMPTLALNRVKDVGEPARFARHVRTDGWDPVRADIRVGDTSSLIELLGGKGLYGDDVMVPLRELIQNAVDAVRARRLLEDGYQGKVRVELRKGKDSSNQEGYWLSVADDGIGMSTAILVGPFLTFGESGWSSRSLKTERPGFVGRRFRHIGRYGIGFFSVFMYSQEVDVSSRQFDAALASTKRLQFSSGLGLRPLLKDATAPSSQVVTEVRIFLSESDAQKILWGRDKTKVAHVGKPMTTKPAFSYTMSQLLGVICPAIDVELVGWDDFSGTCGAVPPNWQTEEPLTWLGRISGVDDIPQIVQEHVEMMTPIGSPDNPTGRAALNPAPADLGVYSVGGLASKRVPHKSRNGHFFGTINGAPSGPRREPIGSRMPELATWASEQAAAWSKVELSPEQQNQIAIAACFFDGDPGALANARINKEWSSLPEIYGLLEEGQTLLAPLTPRGGQEGDWQIMGQVNLQSGFLYHQDDIVIERTHVLTSSPGSESEDYWKVPEEGWPKPYSFVGTLGRYAENRRGTLIIEGFNIDFGYYNGPTLPRMHVENGARIVLPALNLYLGK